jgi:acyl CoA:acetate/3-ketoacid CoA transferase beta subunit
VFERPDRRSPFKLLETAAGVSADDVRQRTGARFTT